MTRVGAVVLAAETRRLGAMVAAARAVGEEVTALVVGARALAETAAGAGADAVTWLETDKDVPVEAYAEALRRTLVLADVPRAVLTAPTPAGRALAGAAAAALNAVLLDGVLAIRLEAEALVVERAQLGGRVLETLVCPVPVVGIFGGPEIPVLTSTTAPIARVEAAAPGDLRIERVEAVPGTGADLDAAERVVAVGRGLRAKADLPLVAGLAQDLCAAVACSMPIADDVGWLPRDRYVGRSGRHLAPRLYLAVGISGAPQHLDGVREAKVVVAVNSDPAAPVFRRADYGVVGDLYEVVPALRAALAAAGVRTGEKEETDG